jgi:hypothetical protein
MNREAVYAALFSLLETAQGFATVSRRLRHWEEVQPEEKPAMFVRQTTETNSGSVGKPPLWNLKGEIYIYVTTEAQIDRDIVPSQLLNPLLDSVTDLFAPEGMEYKQTLGGLVERCYISGPIETSEGSLGDQEVAIIPFTIVVPF